MNSQRADDAGARSIRAHEARANYHFATGSLQPLKDAGDVARVMLAISIYADDIFESQLVSQFVACLDTTAQSQVVRQRKHSGAGGAGLVNRTVARTVVDDEHGHAGDVFVNGVDDA